MPDIKTKDTVRDIKVIDKSAIAKESMKRAAIRAKDTAENLSDDGQVSPSEYAEDNIKYMAENTVDDAGHVVKKETDKAVEKGKDVYRRHREEKKAEKAQQNAERVEEIHTETRNVGIRNEHDDVARTTRSRRTIRGKDRSIKAAEQTERTIKQTAKSTGKATVKTAEQTVKTAEKSVKTAEETAKITVKTAEATAKATEKAAEAAAKAAQKAAELIRQAAIAAYKAAIAAAKAIAAAVKAIIAAMEKLIAAIAAGGWVAVVVVVVICLIGLIVGSIFGIFFSSEDTGSGMTMQQVVQEINLDYQNQLDTIKANNPYDELEMSGSRAVWPEVLSIYAVKTTSDPDNPQEVATVTEEKKQLLENIFWEMNDINYRVETKTEETIVETDDGNGNNLEETVTETKTWLYITVSHKDANQMAGQYGFNTDQDAQLQELLAQDNSMWTAVLYGIYGMDDQIVAVALSQIGNVGGEPYWSWYGFNSRVEWCACFVSWCANQCGYIDTGVCPKYAGCVNGVQWFKDHGQWADNSIEPTPGMIIFFDWNSPNGSSGPQDGQSDHTGIVERVENGVVYTVEGNSGDSCRENHYPVGYYEILGYGILNP